MISARDKELITAASAWLDKRQNPPVHSTAAALRTASGEVFLSLNVDHFSGFVCAETAAPLLAWYTKVLLFLFPMVPLVW